MKAEPKTKDTPESSQVQQLKYYPATETLVVIYKPKGDEYEYYNVPANVAEELWVADSVGKFLNRVIKPSYKYKYIGNGN